MSIASSAGSTPEQPQFSSNNTTDAPVDDVVPPSPEQIKKELDHPSQAPATTGPGDSPILPKVHEDLLNDGIADQVSRREYRRPILIAALSVLTIITLCLAGVIGTLSTGFYQALKPENVSKFVAAELKEKVDKISSEATEKASNSLKLEKPQNTTNKESKPATPKTSDEHSTTKENEPLKVEAKIYGEIRDSMVPLVALVSILTVAIVVILGTMLKAAFAPHPNSSIDLQEKEETSAVPVLEAIKGLVDSIRAAWK